MHYDHVGTFFDFPAAQFHLQDAEMSFATGRYMRHGRFNHGYEVDDVVGMVKLVFKDRVHFHNGSAELAPGVSVHHIGGHTAGLQCVRVATQRGQVVLASDTSHYYEHMEAAASSDRVPCRRDGRRLRQAARLAIAEALFRVMIPGSWRYPAPSTALKRHRRRTRCAAGRDHAVGDHGVLRRWHVFCTLLRGLSA
jgi:glyoxylase-like metal-dependent hydrolase (beta-lactamase superfamily II)